MRSARVYAALTAATGLASVRQMLAGRVYAAWTAAISLVALVQLPLVLLQDQHLLLQTMLATSNCSGRKCAVTTWNATQTPLYSSPRMYTTPRPSGLTLVGLLGVVPGATQQCSWMQRDNPLFCDLQPFLWQSGAVSAFTWQDLKL